MPNTANNHIPMLLSKHQEACCSKPSEFPSSKHFPCYKEHWEHREEDVTHSCSRLAALQQDLGTPEHSQQDKDSLEHPAFHQIHFGMTREHAECRFNSVLSSVVVLIQALQELCCIHILQL